MSFENNLHKYAEVLVKIGINPVQGQPICIESPTEHSEFVTILAEEAYKAGVSKVGVIWKCNSLERVRVENEPVEASETDKTVAEYYASIGAGFIRLDNVDLTTFKGIDSKKLNQKALADSSVRGIFRKKTPNAGQTIACMPTQEWADLVYPELEPEKRMAALWDAVLTCVRCKNDDPVGEWKRYIENTAKRKELLDSKHYKTFHYVNSKTDFTVSPVENYSWQGGCGKTPDGRIFVPNIPTEEVFTTPNMYTANGRLSSSMPLNYRGQIIDNFTLWFENGRIVKAEAEQGQELLNEIIETDEGTHYIGEMALIDQASPIANLKHVFYTTLYDENASCHIAIGMALAPFDKEYKKNHGYNDSKLHVDFMVGTDDMHITGLREDGTWEDVFIDGHWAF